MNFSLHILMTFIALALLQSCQESAAFSNKNGEEPDAVSFDDLTLTVV
mgnify:CR=1 FL=1